MKFTIRTKIDRANHSAVFSLFNESLFKALAPPFPPFRLMRFDGCKKGDRVELELNFLLFKQQWNSLITEDGVSKDVSYFVDEGTRLPFFLRSWKHRHLIKQKNQDVIIEDEIHAEFSSALWKILFFPGLYLSFAYRKPVYRRFFSKILHKSRH